MRTVERVHNPTYVISQRHLRFQRRSTDSHVQSDWSICPRSPRHMFRRIFPEVRESYVMAMTKIPY